MMKKGMKENLKLTRLQEAAGENTEQVQNKFERILHDKVGLTNIKKIVHINLCLILDSAFLFRFKYEHLAFFSYI